MKRPVSPCEPEETLEEQLTALKTARQERSSPMFWFNFSPVEMLKEELFHLKTTVRVMQENMTTVGALEVKILQAGLPAGLLGISAGNVELIYPVMTDQTKETTLLKHEIHHLSVAVEDITAAASLEYQHTRAHEMAIQKLADASTAHPRVDVRREIEMFSEERYFHHQHQPNST
ncbi:uncharacterized protein MELLADRAFT_63194 [Melampsora larici-populina 98AG31]|uniref:Uncharacterized protein n=1 Tax=Melampsora larici-populina (strain 98AG31 / pathotype 3-4-7) TaxID=747676 RepID=F4RLS5_MELLP|nr:uncharacterized protein MELLADRAFT_63194 [Melampsora larici-populina 98AG31]EGG06588.1 hypothetical protein MELLADRAFT_63194 [Melampsora larici-populina 98AG31]